MDYDAVFDTPVGPLGIRLSDGAVSGVDFLPSLARLKPPAGALALEVARQLKKYFHDAGFAFSLPLAESGTPFQRRVWAALRAIPAGDTLTYGVLARSLASSPRAVGGACRANPLPILTPCHRVIARAGVGGFAGRTTGPEVARKRWLLAHERAL